MIPMSEELAPAIKKIPCDNPFAMAIGLKYQALKVMGHVLRSSTQRLKVLYIYGTCTASVSTQYTKCWYHHPCLLNFLTRATVALKPSMNLPLHLCLTSLFFFIPRRS